MPSEPRKVSQATQETLGSLRECLVEGDPEQRHRERRLRRRALVISILTQCAALVALVLVPVLGKTERIALAFATPVPPYSPYRPAAHGPTSPHPPRGSYCRFCAPRFVPPVIVTRDTRPPGADQDQAPFEGFVPGIPSAPADLIPIPDPRARVRPPDANQHASRPTIVHLSYLAPAMLIRRIEPVYPPLAKQTHREGRVELRAIIATDGTIQSLEILSGDAMFYQSAIEAVRLWRYKPTILNGQAVEVDTHIIVIYTMQH